MSRDIGLYQSCKKTIFVQYWNYVFDKFRLNIMHNSIHLELKCVLNEQYCSLFMANMLRYVATISKCPDFLQKMSGILDTRIPPFCNSGRQQMCPLSLIEGQRKISLILLIIQCITSPFQQKRNLVF